MSEIIKAPPSVYIGGNYLSPTDISREQFRKIMASCLDIGGDDLGKLMATYDLAKVSFGYKLVVTRRSGDRYFEHPKAIALIGAVECRDKSLVNSHARLLHDNDEDTRIGVESLQYLIGKEVAHRVASVSNPKKTGDAILDKERKKVHYASIKGDPEAGKIKVPDRIGNLRTHEIRLLLDGFIQSSSASKEQIERWIKNARGQVQETEEYIIPIADTLGGLYISLLLQEFRNLVEGIRAVES
ncbi:MAG: hypothetical protein PHY14_01410 [Candidatus Gracilibacteria bacterium]|nr:hypothetical protein [Candidatus Gracilibacteria bacterium]